MRIIITGSSSGIGRHLAASLALAGHQIWGLARSDQTEWAATIDASGQQVKTTQLDVSDWEAVEAAAAQIAETWAGLDALICCAGLQGEVGAAMTSDPLAWEKTARINITGTFFPIRGLFSAMMNSRSGNRSKIIVFSGGGATKARPFFSAYGSAKTAIVRLAETLAAEWEKLPVDINAIAPGTIYTAMTEETIRLGPEKAGQQEYESALRVRGQKEDSLDRVTRLINFLLSKESDFVTGRLISAVWDPWEAMATDGKKLTATDHYTLRRVVPS